MAMTRMGSFHRIAVVALCLTASACGMRLRSPIAPVVAPPSTFVASTSDVRGTRVIDVRDGFQKPNAFKIASDFLTQRYAVDVSDAHAGYLMTPWQASSLRNGVPDLRYRTRIVIRFLGDEWRQVSVRAEANWQHGDGWDIGYDAKLLDDVSAEILSRLGKK